MRPRRYRVEYLRAEMLRLIGTSINKLHRYSAMLNTSIQI